MEKILIIDNSPLEQRILKDILKDSYEVITSSNGLDAVEKTKELSPTLILLDMYMPNMDSFAVLASLSALTGRHKVPIVATTSTQNVDLEEKALVLGAVDCFSKPFIPKIVRARVRTHVELYLLRLKISELALVDALTGIPNRRSYEERVKFECGHAMRENAPLSFSILDIDCFKNYNDHYGHLKGDEVLRLVSAEMQHALTRRTDFVARYGGEEFVFVMPNTNKNGGIAVAERVRKAIENLRIPHVASCVSDVLTASIGGATFIPDKDFNEEKIFLHADKMLFKSKDKGRNITLWA